MSDFSLYIHIPYCVAKCPYCDFNSHAASQWPERDYTNALIAELRQYASQEPWRGGSLRTIFFGGGTPSLFAPESIGAVLEAAFRLWPNPDSVESAAPACGPKPPALRRPPVDVSADAPSASSGSPEITLEANPG